LSLPTAGHSLLRPRYAEAMRRRSKAKACGTSEEIAKRLNALRRLCYGARGLRYLATAGKHFDELSVNRGGVKEKPPRHSAPWRLASLVPCTNLSVK